MVEVVLVLAWILSLILFEWRFRRAYQGFENRTKAHADNMKALYAKEAQRLSWHLEGRGH